MKVKDKKRWAISITTGTIILIALMITFLKWPSYVFTLDINPSLEITTNRLGQFVDVKGLNDDGRKFLDDYEVKDRNLEVAINDLIDRMILTGYISGGEDNVVMISVNNDELDKAYVEKVNTAIAAYLENKQLEYLILNQGWDDEFDDGDYQDMSKGKATIVQKIIDQDSELSAEELADVNLKDLLIIAERLDLSPQEVFTRAIGEYDLDDDKDFGDDKEIDALAGASVNLEQDDDDDDDDGDNNEASNSISEVIGRERAIEIAKDRVGGGEVDEFEYDRDDQEYEIKLRYEGYEYEVEINAVSGTITDFEQDDELDDDKEIDALAGASVNLEQDDDDDDDDGDNNEASNSISEVIGRERAIEIAKDRVGGGEVDEFEYDRDDQEYEIKLRYEGYEYEVEINAVSGTITDFEQDDELDDDKEIDALARASVNLEQDDDDDDDTDDRDDKDGASNSISEVIGRERAIEIAKDRVGGGEVEEVEYDQDDQKYEIELKHEEYEYEIEINAVTGVIIGFEQDE